MLYAGVYENIRNAISGKGYKDYEELKREYVLDENLKKLFMALARSNKDYSYKLAIEFLVNYMSQLDDEYNTTRNLCLCVTKCDKNGEIREGYMFPYIFDKEDIPGYREYKRDLEAQDIQEIIETIYREINN